MRWICETEAVAPTEVEAELAAPRARLHALVAGGGWWATDGVAPAAEAPFAPADPSEDTWQLSPSRSYAWRPASSALAVDTALPAELAGSLRARTSHDHVERDARGAVTAVARWSELRTTVSGEAGGAAVVEAWDTLYELDGEQVRRVTVEGRRSQQDGGSWRVGEHPEGRVAWGSTWTWADGIPVRRVTFGPDGGKQTCVLDPEDACRHALGAAAQAAWRARVARPSANLRETLPGVDDEGHLVSQVHDVGVSDEAPLPEVCGGKWPAATHRGAHLAPLETRPAPEVHASLGPVRAGLEATLRDGRPARCPLFWSTAATVNQGASPLAACREAAFFFPAWWTWEATTADRVDPWTDEWQSDVGPPVPGTEPDRYAGWLSACRVARTPEGEQVAFRLGGGEWVGPAIRKPWSGEGLLVLDADRRLREVYLRWTHRSGNQDERDLRYDPQTGAVVFETMVSDVGGEWLPVPLTEPKDDTEDPAGR